MLCASILYSDQIIHEITFDELSKLEIFIDHDLPGIIRFPPYKCTTYFQWPSKIHTISKANKDYIDNMFENNEFTNMFTHYVEWETLFYNERTGNTLNRYIRLYLQDNLMPYIKEELVENDYMNAEYWIGSPFNPHDQIIHCFLVGYAEAFRLD
jgi:hypothetical protein